MRRAGILFGYPRGFKGCFNAYVLSSLEYCALVWMSSAESYLGLLDSIFLHCRKVVKMSLVVWGAEVGLVLVFAL